MQTDEHATLVTDPSEGDSFAVDSEDEQQGDETWEDWEEDESDRVKSLFSNDTFATVDETIAFDAQQHNFDLNKYRSEIQATEYDTFKIINYIRSQVAAGNDPRPLLSAQTTIESKPQAPWQDESYLVPIIENDEFLFYEWEERPDEGMATGEDISSLLQEMHEMAMDDAVRELVLGASQPSTAVVQQNEHKSDDYNEIDASYFESYSFFDIHRDMLSDKVRTESYQKALENNPELIKNATVLDVGCGTGVLSMFAARGGASQVISVDGSPEIAAIAREICMKNGFNQQQINVLSTKIEKLDQLPNVLQNKVDVLVSEWMGYALLFESMLDSVLIARDRFLKPGGAILPDTASIYVAGAGIGATGLDFWRNVYGFDMSIIAEKLQESALKEAMVRVVDPNDIITEQTRLISLDLASMTAEDQDFSSEFSLSHSNSASCSLHCFVLWFDVSFSERFCASSPQILPTSPWDTPTHWAQTVLPLPVAIDMSPTAAIQVKGRLSMARRKDMHRTLDISVEYTPVFADGKIGETQVQLYSMGVNSTTSK